LSELRPIVEFDWQLLREIRLRALLDSPDSFGPTYEATVAEPESLWRRWASGAEGRFQVIVALDTTGNATGLISCSVRESGAGGLGALWVAPEVRGMGLGRELMRAGIAWLESHGCGRIELHVTDGNPAESLYESLGFSRTGARHPLREGSPLFEVTMSRELAPESA
jgi:GNAT superfamily N-acetyltransferase